MSILFSLIKDIVRRKPDQEKIRAIQNLDFALYEQGGRDDAIEQYQQVLASHPNHIDTLFNLAMAYDNAQELDKGLECYRKILTLDSKHTAARLNILHRMQHRCEWGTLKAEAQKIRKAVLEAPVAMKNLLFPFSFLAVPGATGTETRRCAERYAQLAYRSLYPLRSQMGFDFNRPPNAKIRVGYFSADLRKHAVSFLMAEVFELHDRNRFHISAYSYGADDLSPLRDRIEKSVDRFVDIRELRYEEAARRIYADRIDILVDLTGYTKDSRSGTLALRPAPIQVNYLGFPGTMGADFIDYIIADAFVIPPGCEKYYSEKPMRLADCFQANDTSRPRLQPPTRSECGLPENGFVFCCFNQAFKVTPEFFDTWCRLLKAVPDSVLWMTVTSEIAETNLRKEMEQRGLAPERLVLAPFLERDQHLARLQCADLFLDTLPFNAGTTCSDALWMGLPVLTCTGTAFASRMAGSLLTALNVPELITHNLNDYSRLALELAQDRNKLDAIRSKIVANRTTAPLFDSKRFTRNLEQAYLNMLQDAGRVPPAQAIPA